MIDTAKQPGLLLHTQSPFIMPSGLNLFFSFLFFSFLFFSFLFFSFLFFSFLFFSFLFFLPMRPSQQMTGSIL